MKKFLAIFITIISLVMVSCGSPIEINEPENISNDSTISIPDQIIQIKYRGVDFSHDMPSLCFESGEITVCVDIHYDTVIAMREQHYENHYLKINDTTDLNNVIKKITISIEDGNQYNLNTSAAILSYNNDEIINEIPIATYNIEIIDTTNNLYNVKYVCNNFKLAVNKYIYNAY